MTGLATLTVLAVLVIAACGGEEATSTSAPEGESGGSVAAPTASSPETGTPTEAAEATRAATSAAVATEAPVPSGDTATALATTAATVLPQASPVPTEPPTSAASAASGTSAPADGGEGPARLVEPDPNWQSALEASQLRTGIWQTDFSLHTVPYDEFLSGGVPRDGIPPLDDPKFQAVGDADLWLEDVQPVVALEINGEARAYPLAILTWHEIANDTLGGVPVAVTFCPLCNSAVAFDRRLGGVVLDFGVSGKLRHSDLVMWDRQTESWWQQLTGEGIVGAYAGYQLEYVPAQIVSWGDFKSSFPEADVLSRDTGYGRSYGRNPYAGYDRVDQSPFLFRGDPDGRLLPMERVVALQIDGTRLAFPFLVLEEERVVHYELPGWDIVVLFQPGTASALDESLIAESRDVGATGVFVASVKGQKLTFRPGPDGFIDDQTGSVWNVLGQAVSGPLAGESLPPIVHGNHFWFAWAAFAPGTVVYQGE